MGVSIRPAAAPARGATADSAAARRLPRWLRSATTLRRLAAASVAANVIIVITGGAVRLTNSGLGCPTWPSCTDASLTPTKAYAVHGIIEFTNRQLTFLLAVIAVLTWLSAMACHRGRALATAAALGIPAQAVLGGLTVLTHLNPWLVGLHFLCSMALIAITFALWSSLAEPPGPGLSPTVPTPTRQVVRALTGATTAVAAAVLVLGTIVTGAGPHAGDKRADGTVHRNGLRVASMAQLHADAVMVLIGLTVGLLALLAAVRAGRAATRAAAALLGIELAQGIIGYTQYFLHVPPLLVLLHMAGACAVWLAMLRLAAATTSAPARAPSLRTAG